MSVRQQFREQIRRRIEDEIRQRGAMPFSRYMEICLYDPGHGYYASHAEQFGKAGDFYTSSDVHAVFGRLLARQFQEVWQVLDRPAQIEILELGPGRGLFARDVLDWSKKKFPDFFDSLTYTLQESSPALRAKLAENLAQHLEARKARIAEDRSEEDRPEEDRPEEDRPEEDRPEEDRPEKDRCNEDRCGQVQRSLAPDAPVIIFANEFFDALPVEILSPHGKLHLALEAGRLREVWLPPLAAELDFLDHYGVHPEAGERIEVPMVAQSWIRPIAQSIQRGILLLIDYGYTRAEQLAGRHRGTLMAYRHHSVSPDPYQAPGEQDLTAHVNFTALAAACDESAMEVEKLLTQSQFLMGIGEKNQFADAFEDCRIPQERAKVALQLKHLITPVGMGENFQVMIAARRLDSQVIAAISGLSFGRGY